MRSRLELVTDRCPFPSCRPKRPRCCARTSLPRRRFNESKLVRWERRNADYTRVKSFEYKVHVTVRENENDIEGEKTIVWAPLEILMSIEGLDYEDLKEMIENFETEIEAERDEALAVFEPTGQAF